MSDNHLSFCYSEECVVQVWQNKALKRHGSSDWTGFPRMLTVEVCVC